MTYAAWFSLPITDSRVFLVIDSASIIYRMSYIQAMYLSNGNLISRARASVSQPSVIWTSAGAPSASNFAGDRFSLLGTGSLSPAWGLMQA